MLYTAKKIYLKNGTRDCLKQTYKQTNVLERAQNIEHRSQTLPKMISNLLERSLTHAQTSLAL